MPLSDDFYGRTSEFEIVLERARRNIDGWTKDLQAKVEKWTAENGFAPATKEQSLALIDELKARGVKSFEGLGIKVTF